MAQRVKKTSRATPAATIGLVRSVWRTEANALGCEGAVRVCPLSGDGAVVVDVIDEQGSHRPGRYGRPSERDRIETNAERVQIADAECE